MSRPPTALVVDDEPNILHTLTLGLQAAGLEVQAYGNPVDALEHLHDTVFDIAFIDLMMKPVDGMHVLREIRTRSPLTTSVMITAHGSVDSAVEAMKNGAFDFLQKPFDLKELRLFVAKVLEHHSLRAEVRRLREELEARQVHGQIITRNPAMRQQLDLAAEVADSPLTVLIEGDSGTGKELVARFIHERSGRGTKPFLSVNCAALAESLLESELFGHVKGAFTGALRDREGRFEAAEGGTVFLDEVGEIPAATQVKLLRFLQDREFERVGENVPRRVDVRVIAATNRRLADALKEGTFREDLYYRINAVRLYLPPLRERPEDLLLLVYHFIRKFAGEEEVEVSPEALKLLTSYRWPGNVRELENVMERAVLLAKAHLIEPAHLPAELVNPDGQTTGLLSLEELERQHIRHVLQVASDLDEAARVLEIDPATLWRKRKKYGL